MGDIILETERLILRKPVIEDAEEMSKYNEREEFYRYLPMDPPTKESTKKFVESIIESFKNHFIIVDKKTGMVIGDICLGIKEKHPHSASFGYGLNPAYWGKGYMTEALRVVLKFGFEELKLKRIYGTLNPANKSSEKVMKKCGLQYEGHHRCERVIRGEYCDDLYYSILDTEWNGGSHE